MINKQIIVLFFASFFSACNINSMNAVPIAPIAAIGGGVATFAGGARLRQLYGNLAKLDKKKLEKKLKADPDFTGTTEEISDTKEEARERSRIMWKIRSLQFVITVGAVAVAAVFFWKNREKKPDGTGTDNDVRDLVKKILGEDLAKKVFYLQTGDSESKSYGKLSKDNAITSIIVPNEVTLSDEDFTKLRQVEKLESLHIQSSDLEEISSKIGDLLSLKGLQIDLGSALTSLPSEIGKLTNLESLIMEALQGKHSALTTLPKEIFNLQSLKTLIIKRAFLKFLPQDIGKFINLTNLSFSRNKIESLPEQIYDLTNLKLLNLSHNKIGEISEKIGNLINLKELYLYNNQLTELPKNLQNLKQLEILNLNHNKLSKGKGGVDLNEFIGDLKKILEGVEKCHIYLVGNGFTEEDKEEIEKEVGGKNFARLSFDLFKPEEGDTNQIGDSSQIKSLEDKAAEIKEVQDLMTKIFGSKASSGPEKEAWIIYIQKNNSGDYNNIVDGGVKSITSIDARDMELDLVSSDIGKLINLNYLNLNHNQLKKLPKNLNNLKKLKALYLRSNQLSKRRGGVDLNDFINDLKNILENLKECKIYLASNGFSKKDQEKIKQDVEKTDFPRVSFS